MKSPRKKPDRVKLRVSPGGAPSPAAYSRLQPTPLLPSVSTGRPRALNNPLSRPSAGFPFGRMGPARLPTHNIPGHQRLKSSQTPASAGPPGIAIAGSYHGNQLPDSSARPRGHPPMTTAAGHSPFASHAGHSKRPDPFLFPFLFSSCCILCACEKYDECHRRLVAEALRDRYFGGELSIANIGARTIDRK